VARALVQRRACLRHAGGEGGSDRSRLPVCSLTLMITLRTSVPPILIRLADALIVLLSMLGASGLHAVLLTRLDFIRSASLGSSGFVLLAYLALPIWLVVGAVLQLDRIPGRRWSLGPIALRLAALHALGLAGLTAMMFVTQTPVNRSIIGTFLILCYASMLLVRIVLMRWTRRQHAKGHGRERLLLVGEPGPVMAAFVAEMAESPLPPETVGYLGRAEASADLPARLGSLRHLPEILHRVAVDAVIVLGPLSPRRAAWVVHVCSDLGLAAGLTLPTDPRGIVPYVAANRGIRFLTFGPTKQRRLGLAIKQLVDLGCAMLGLLLLSPLLLAVAIAIRLVDGSPVLFVQHRIGLHGRRFAMLKFRTMVREADSLKQKLLAQNELDGPAFKLTHDPRVTRLGAFLRSTSLDELPQLFNVLDGSMSLVGPRPLPVDEQQRIRGTQRRRLSMKPGITGRWQVSGRSDVGFAGWMSMDLDYVDRWSLRLDLRILAATIPAVLRRRGAR
jgi:exopolysaccharide biosynthesis polyprenyl glycosylphosphotransferase